MGKALPERIQFTRRLQTTHKKRALNAVTATTP
jgi:hypothetical protein